MTDNADRHWYMDMFYPQGKLGKTKYYSTKNLYISIDTYFISSLIVATKNVDFCLWFIKFHSMTALKKSNIKVRNTYLRKGQLFYQYYNFIFIFSKSNFSSAII